jgi:hypothetical protein
MLEVWAVRLNHHQWPTTTKAHAADTNHLNFIVTPTRLHCLYELTVQFGRADRLAARCRAAVDADGLAPRSLAIGNSM